jgi:glycerophosphoryl diester phosphodiesterase
MASIAPVLTDALRDLSRSWRSLASTDIVYKVIAFAVLTPAATLLLYLLRLAASERVVADADIARFLLTSPWGIASLLVGASVIVAISAVETACLMAIGVGAAYDVTVDARTALRFGASHAWGVLRLAANMVVRLVIGLLPFVAAAGLLYLALLRDHDINYYLSVRPREWRIALIFLGLLAIPLVALLLRTLASWAFSLPLLIFERMSPRQSLAESARRVFGSRVAVLLVLAVWAAIVLALAYGSAALIDSIGRSIGPSLASSLPLLLTFVSLVALVASVCALAVGVVGASLFSLLISRLYLRVGAANVSREYIAQYESRGVWRLSPRAWAGVATVAVLVAIGIGFIAFLIDRNQRPALVIAHRGSSITAPENTLAAFRLAAEQHTDFIELDVQESADGEVLVVHDSDLMKVGRYPAKIWEADAAALESVDIGSFKAPNYSGERVPTLAAALAVCKGVCRVVVELKSYGHNQRLEERVIDVVEQAGMQDDCIFMSLDYAMVKKLKQLRPNWRVGALVAKAIGDLTELHADFLAVEARMATRRFVRVAHRAGQDVYIWTVDDAAWMLLALSRGVDGLITNKPDLARQVIERRAQMSDSQRFLLAQLIRLGASTQALEAEDALRP